MEARNNQGSTWGPLGYENPLIKSHKTLQLGVWMPHEAMHIWGLSDEYDGQIRTKYLGSSKRHTSVDSNKCLHIICTYRYSQIHKSELFCNVNRMPNSNAIWIWQSRLRFVWSDIVQEILWMTGTYCDSLCFLLRYMWPAIRCVYNLYQLKCINSYSKHNDNFDGVRKRLIDDYIRRESNIKLMPSFG